MTLFKDILPNDNVFIWLGSFDNTQVNNVLVLAGGEVLILKAIRRFDLIQEQIRKDLLEMSIREFIDAYDLIEFESIINDFEGELNNNKEDYENKVIEIIEDIKEGVINKKYPPYMARFNEYYIIEFKNMINKYLHKLSNLSNSKDAINHLEDVIDECEERIQKIKKEHLKKEVSMLEKIKKISKSPGFDELHKIQKEIDEEANNLRNKIRKATKKFEELKKLFSK